MVYYSVLSNQSTTSRTGTITIGDQTFTVTQSGRQPDISVKPSPVNFGGLKTNKSSSKTVKITNSGAAPLSIGDINITDSGSFSISKNGCSKKALQKNKSCAATIKFSPASTGQYNGTLTIQSNDADTPTAAISLQGIGI